MSESIYEAVLKSEDRSRRYKERRKRQLRRRFLMAVGAAFLTAFLALSYHAILSEAKEKAEASYKYYTSIEIPYGATLWEIAQTYRTEEYESAEDYIHEVMEINHLQDESVLKAGNYLIVPYYSSELK